MKKLLLLSLLLAFTVSPGCRQNDTGSEGQSITVYVTRTGECYHRGNCSYLRKSKIPIALEDAKEDYRPCSRCKPPTEEPYPAEALHGPELPPLQ